MRVLLTCFDPFAGAEVNASELAVMAVDEAALPKGVELVRLRLPTVFGQSVCVLREALGVYSPDVVVCVGQSGPDPRVAVETVARNWDAPKIPDNAGKKPEAARSIPAAPDALPSTLPTSSLVDALRGAGIAARLSESAGDFVCNHVFFGLMHELGRRDGMRGGFVHLPCLPEVGAPGLPTAVAARALEVIVTVSVRGG